MEINHAGLEGRVMVELYYDILHREFSYYCHLCDDWEQCSRCDDAECLGCGNDDKCPGCNWAENVIHTLKMMRVNGETMLKTAKDHGDVKVNVVEFKSIFKPTRTLESPF